MAESFPSSPDEPQQPAAVAEQPGETAPAPGRGSRHPRLIAALAASLAALVLAAGIGVAGAYPSWHRPASHIAATSISAPPHTVSQPNSALSEAPVDAQAVASQVSPAVVDINTVLASARGIGRAAGTGMILTSSGLVLTNNHVVKGSTSINVTVQGRSGSYVATVVGVDPTDDVALLQLQGASSLPKVTLADSSTLRIGETVVALGNALGAGGAPSVTQGVITALDQSITASDGGGAEHLSGLIESNAQISPGDSGGPLVNSAGQVVGMITAGTATSPRQASTTDGYAIPSNTALGIVDQIESGQPSPNIYLGATGYLGVAVSDITPVVGSRLGRPVASGALVEQVVAGSPAATAGISAGAVITRVGDAPVSSSADLGPAIWRHKPGEKVRVDWVDQGGTHSVMVILASGPAA